MVQLLYERHNENLSIVKRCMKLLWQETGSKRDSMADASVSSGDMARDY